MTGRPISIFVLLILILLSLPIQAERERLALVIGNNNYESAPLRNPVNDANDMAEMLMRHGFKVNTLINARQKEMEQAIRSFTSNLNKNSVGLFYFAGHGIELDGENYLIPIKADIEVESDVRYEAVAVGRLLEGMHRTDNNLNLVVLDACRNNPYSRRFRSGTRGLSEMRPASGTMILYATEPGNVALDGTGRNGLFTEQLLKFINEEGLTVEQAFKKTAIAVSDKTSGRQKPWYEGIIFGEFYFFPDSKRLKNTVSTNSAITIQPNQDERTELLFWESVEKSPSLENYKVYLERWPDGHFVELARMKLQKDQKKSLTENKQLSAKEIEKLFSGKTVSHTNHIKQVDTIRYYNPNGELELIVLNFDIRMEGRWSVTNDGRICHKIKSNPNICLGVIRDGETLKIYSPNGSLGASFKNFREGNQL